MISDQANKEDLRLSYTVLSPFLVLSVQYLVLSSQELAQLEVERLQLMSKAVVGIVFAFALPLVLRRKRRMFLLTYLVSALVFLLHYWVFPNNSVYLQTVVFPFFFTCLPAFLYAQSILDWQVFQIAIVRVSRLVFAAGLATAVLVVLGKATVGPYSMSFGYYLLLPAVVGLDRFLDNPSIADCIVFTLSILQILAFGSRGPIMCIGLFLLLRLARSFGRLSRPQVVLHLVLTTSALLIMLVPDAPFKLLEGVFSSLGVTSRSIRLFSAHELSLSGRDRIYSKVLEQIANNPLMGIGLAGDRRVLGGTYAHNLVAEMVANYGIPLGSMFILFLLFLMIRLWASKDTIAVRMCMVWTSIGIAPLFVSGSYLTDIPFWIATGFAVGYGPRRSLARLGAPQSGTTR